MKKHVLLATGLAVLSTGAYASKARMEALGQDSTRGSFYIDDTRNVFRNASDLNNTKNYVITEWNDNASAEGGFFREAGSFAYGLYFGNDGDANGASFENKQNTIDLFFSGDMGVKWGARLNYSKFEDKSSTPEKTADGMELALGMEMGAIKAHFDYTLKDEAKGSTLAADKFDRDGFNLGATYDWNNMTFFAEYSSFSKESTDNAVKTETDNTDLTIGVGHTHEVSSTARVFTDVSYVMTEEDVKGGTKTETSSLPVVVGFEADATSWLVLRGSIKQNVLINSSKVGGKDKTQTNTTDVAAGATLNFGKLKVDGIIGTGDSGTTDTGALNLDRAMTKVAVSYWF